ncbi:hypothetical protein BKA69DRAFT_1121286 [Paraphysoderma sedebokerense]|nr:hypothetical protein BKA69DRAFT_1121286 [Paraphysoderma sedebokerense]
MTSLDFNPNLVLPFNRNTTKAALEMSQTIGLVGCIVGATCQIGYNLITSSALQQFRRKNALIYYAILIGSIASIISVLSILLGLIYGFSDVWAAIAFIGWMIYSFSVYSILIERIIPVLPIFVQRNLSPASQDTMRAVLPFLLNLPQMIVVVTVTSRAPNTRLFTIIMRAIGNLLFLLANIVLTILFIKALLRNRSNHTVAQVYMSHKRFVLKGIAVAALDIFLIVVRFLLISPKFQQSAILWAFHTTIHGMIVLGTFEMYIFITMELPKQIFAEKISLDVPSKNLKGESSSNGFGFSQIGKSILSKLNFGKSNGHSTIDPPSTSDAPSISVEIA